MGCLRFLLAFAVAGNHAAGGFNYPGIYMNGGDAVHMFYLISGFLIALILRDKYAESGNWIFYSNRAVKIFVPYWTVLGVTVALSALFYMLTGDAVLLNSFVREGPTMSLPTWLFALATNLFILGQEFAFRLIYRAGELFYSLQAMSQPANASQFTIINPAWSISIELAFYAVAPFILRRSLPVIAAVAYASYWLSGAYYQGHPGAPTDYQPFPFELNLFLFGSLSYFFYDFLRRNHALRPNLSAGFTALLATLVILHPRWVDIKPYQFFVLVAVLLPALFDFSSRHSWDRWLGNLSYPLYLVHSPILNFGQAIAHLPQISAWTHTLVYPHVLLAISLAASVGINHLIVNPIDSWRQARVRRPAIPSSAVTTSPVAQPATG
jgi:peptidoglycan/LPS O-acetylase OafA/YrhL